MQDGVTDMGLPGRVGLGLAEEHEQVGKQQTQAGVAGQISISALPPKARLSGYSLVDLIGRGNDLSEEEHMQPAVMTFLRAAATALGSSAYLEDTHEASCRLSFPNNQPDVTCLAAAGIPSWAHVVWTGKFKVGDTPAEISTAIGQGIKRFFILRSLPLFPFTFDGQDAQRQHAVALILTLNSLELLWIQKAPLGGISVSSTGQQPFSVSPRSPGFTWLARLLLTPRDQLGYFETAVPELSRLDDVPVGSLQLVCKGTKDGSGSYIWRCQTAGREAILKLNRDDQEACVPPVCLHSKPCSHCSPVSIHGWHHDVLAIKIVPTMMMSADQPCPLMDLLKTSAGANIPN